MASRDIVANIGPQLISPFQTNHLWDLDFPTVLSLVAI